MWCIPEIMGNQFSQRPEARLGSDYVIFKRQTAEFELHSRCIREQLQIFFKQGEQTNAEIIQVNYKN